MKRLIYIPLIGLLSVQLTLNLPAFALFRESHVATDDNILMVTTDSEAGQFGSALESGDFNDDGYSDLLVASPFYSDEEREWVGKVEIVWGGVDSTIDRTSYIGISEGEQLGSSVATGDFNGDGIDDIAMGAYNALYGEVRTGKVYVIEGISHLVSPMSSRDFAYDRPDSRLNGNRSDNGLYGLSMFAADLNADGFSDLLVGSPGASGPSSSNVGAVFFHRGSESGLSKFSSKTRYGGVEGGMYGSSVAGGYLNADDEADLVVGSHVANKGEILSAGAVYYIQNFLDKSDSIKTKKYIYGKATNQWLGFRLGIEDLNNDKLDDLVVSSFPFRGNGGQASVQAYYGGNEFYTEFADLTINNPIGSSLLGADLEFSDLNNDGYVDIVSGAPSVDFRQNDDSGRVYVVYSTGGSFNANYSLAAGDLGSVIVGNEVDDWFGYSVEALDFNGDDIVDLAVGARYANGEVSVNDGAVYLLIGDGDKFGEVRVSLEVNDDEIVTRGEFISTVVNSFNLANEKANYVSSCYDYLEFCLFNFMAASYFDGISLEPELILYPDVPVGADHYEEINLATILGIVNGYLGEPESPFHPELAVTRIQALKMIFGATDLVKPLYRFELEDQMGDEGLGSQSSYFADIEPEIDYMWWYPRYANFAVEAGIVEPSDIFRPDDLISKSELEDMILETLEYLKMSDEEIES
jgi:hypothetical protein